MLKIKATILSLISAVLLISDLIITPYKITYAHKPILAFLGILLISYLDELMISSTKSVRLRKIFYYYISILFVVSLVSLIIIRQHVYSFPFIVGCFIQSFINLRGMIKASKSATDFNLYESPLPDVGFKIMSFVLFIRDLMLNHKNILESAGIKEGDIVLDYGCGPGAFTFAASKIVGKCGMVYALDNQHLAIEAVTNRIRREGISNVKTIYTNQGETGLPDNSIDYTLLIGVLHVIRNPNKTLQEIKRVMKDDGKLLLVIMHTSQADAMTTIDPFFTVDGKVKQMYVLKKRF